MKIENIKFKAKRLDGKGWAIGSLIKESYSAMIIEDTATTYAWRAVDPSTVCQFTGLKDSEGNELYEHDVIKCHPFIPSEIVWSEELSGYYLTRANGKIYEKPLVYYLSLGKFIVVGNKFDEKYRMKKKILDLAKSAVWFVLCLLVGALIFEGIRSLANSNEPAKRVGISVITEEEHDYLVVDTKHGVCVIHAESCPCLKKK